jgi:hypothetical protein
LSGFGIITEALTLEQYDPNSELWKTEPAKLTYSGGAFVMLSDGRVLITMGLQDVVSLGHEKECEIYDSKTSTITPTDKLEYSEYPSSLTLLGDGRVLYICPVGCEVYDPKAGTWKQAAKSMLSNRMNANAVLLKSGKVLLCGGNGACELYDPLSDTWSPTGKMKYARWGNTATLLNNGQVLVTGGYGDDENVTSSCELYDPVTGRWSLP